jgi:CRP-like cAMP-binding protein
MPARKTATLDSGEDPGALVRELRILQRLVAITLVQGKTQVDGIGVLGRTGMDRNEIARVCGTSPEVVSVRLAEAKRKKK